MVLLFPRLGSAQLLSLCTGKDINGIRLTFLLRPSCGRGGVEPFATPPATEYDTASSVGDQLDVMSLAEGELEMEEMSHQLPETTERTTDETEPEAERETEDEGPMQLPYRRAQSLLADMRKSSRTCGTGLGRGQSLWSFVFS